MTSDLSCDYQSLTDWYSINSLTRSQVRQDNQNNLFLWKNKNCVQFLHFFFPKEALFYPRTPGTKSRQIRWFTGSLNEKCLEQQQQQQIKAMLEKKKKKFPRNVGRREKRKKLQVPSVCVCVCAWTPKQTRSACVTLAIVSIRDAACGGDSRIKKVGALRWVTSGMSKIGSRCWRRRGGITRDNNLHIAERESCFNYYYRADLFTFGTCSRLPGDSPRPQFFVNAGGWLSSRSTCYSRKLSLCNKHRYHDFLEIGCKKSL